MVDREPLRPGAVSCHVSGAHDAVADCEACGLRSHGFHHPGKLSPQDDSSARFGAAHLPNRRVTRIDSHGADPDEQIRVARPWFPGTDELSRDTPDRAGP